MLASLNQALRRSIWILAGPLLAQSPALTLPEASPRASVVQTVGLTEIAITYNRPKVNNRKVWGGLVAFNQVWRAGANENTVIAFSTPVSVGGTKLPAGRYGLHMLPTASEWTVILSSQSKAWGSYGYDPKEDVVRFKVSPEPAELVNALAYTFEDPTETGVGVSLRWEKLRVPFRVEVDSNQVVAASLRNQLRGMHQFYAEAWSGAAAWCVQHGANLEEALVWIDRSLAIKPTFSGLRTKAVLLEKRGDAQGAEALRAKALAIASETDINLLGYSLLAQGKTDEAIGMFQKNVKDHPGSWNVYDSLAEGLAAKGDRTKALALYGKAHEMVGQEDQKKRIEAEMAKLK